jgi:demethylmenaquinone methyltransferase/2-methoxy-6-polyprenyl-1,4-benzoquinol methylase
MCEIASGKFAANRNVEIICEDIEEFRSDKSYDAIIVYNSFPHFLNAEKLIAHLSSLLNKNGILTIAHGTSRDRINSHHSNVSDDIKCELMNAEELAKIFSHHLQVNTVISNDRMYQVAGRKV